MDELSEKRVGKGKRFSNALGNTRGNSINGKAAKDRRREEAFARENASQNLSIADKLKRMPKTGAARQRARYEKSIEFAKLHAAKKAS